MIFARSDQADAGSIGSTVGRPPRSAVPLGDGLVGLAGLVSAWLLVMALRPHAVVAAWLVLLATALPMLWRELRRSPAPARRAGGPSAPLVWLFGFVVAATPLFLVHAQGNGPLLWSVGWAIIAPAFVLRLLFEWHRNGTISGGFPAGLGKALLPPSRAGLAALAAPARLWILKAFYIPIYAASLLALISLAFRLELAGPGAWLTLAVLFAYTIDLGFGLAGYVFASNDLVPTLRSTQTSILGWVVCILCYGPVITHWPDYEAAVKTEINWPTWMTGDPIMLLGAIGMIVLLALYVSATVCFGLRFCNLANRGLVSAGPYRLMKHPAYFAHVGNAWIITLIFLPATGMNLGLPQLLVPVCFTVLYRLRATTEERHMSEDPAYVAYAAWIAEHGLLSRLKRLVGLHRAVVAG